ncbi:M23 family metallopeptidase [Tropicibacter sp. S64]|uniref:M23 family metallopeptidase n=1 Tax=Tropicibacter sp. S64 TaxID=3415122 RepID=UPI003C7A8A07
MFRLLAMAALCLLPTLGAAKITCDAAKQSICVEEVQRGNEIDLYLLNRFPLLPVTVTIRVQMENLRADTNSTRTLVLNGSDRRRLMTLSKRDPSRAWRYDYTFDWSRGDVTARESGHRYRPPFASGAAFAVTQGCNSRRTHTPDERNALDFDMPTGTPVHAARAGRVVDVKAGSNRGGRSKSFGEDANYVILQHSDRTLGIYYHLRKNGVAVALGSQIAEGQLIGYSGNTGYSTGPHLHFAVTKGTTRDGEESLRIAFRTPRGAVACPREGSILRAP